MAYRIEAIPIILSDLQGHSHTATASRFKCDSSYSCSGFNKISTDISK